MYGQDYRFKLKNDLSELNALRRHLDEWAGRTGLPDDSVSRINVCLDEMFTNIVSYAFKDNSEHTVHFMLNGDNHMVTIKIEDDGIPFNPLERVDPELHVNIDRARIGVLGTHIIKNLMDSVCYERKQYYNKLAFKMYLQQLQ